MNWNCFVFDYSLVDTESPYLLLIIYSLVFIVIAGPKSLFELVFDGLMVFYIGDSPFSIYFSGVDQID